MPNKTFLLESTQWKNWPRVAYQVIKGRKYLYQQESSFSLCVIGCSNCCGRNFIWESNRWHKCYGYLVALGISILFDLDSVFESDWVGLTANHPSSLRDFPFMGDLSKLMMNAFIFWSNSIFCNTGGSGNSGSVFLGFMAVQIEQLYMMMLFILTGHGILWRVVN